MTRGKATMHTHDLRNVHVILWYLYALPLYLIFTFIPNFFPHFLNLESTFSMLYTFLLNVPSIMQLSVMFKYKILQEHVIYHSVLHARPPGSLYGGSIEFRWMLSAIWITGHRGFQSIMQFERNRYGNSPKCQWQIRTARALKVACYWEKREEWQGNERLEDKEMDEAGQETEKGKWSKITQNEDK